MFPACWFINILCAHLVFERFYYEQVATIYWNTMVYIYIYIYIYNDISIYIYIYMENCWFLLHLRDRQMRYMVSPVFLYYCIFQRLKLLRERLEVLESFFYYTFSGVDIGKLLPFYPKTFTFSDDYPWEQTYPILYPITFNFLFLSDYPVHVSNFNYSSKQTPTSQLC